MQAVLKIHSGVQCTYRETLIASVVKRVRARETLKRLFAPQGREPSEREKIVNNLLIL